MMGWESGITAFGDVLYAAIARRGWSVREFAEKAKTQHTALSAIKGRRRPPPLKHMERWAVVLGLEGREREYFLDLAALACAPERVLRMFEPNHPAHEPIRLAIERQTLMRLHAAETGEPYDPPKSPRRGRRSQR